MARPTLRPHGRGTKLVALLCSSLLACTTVRSHVSTIAPEVMLREGHATIQLDLWVESNRPLTPEEEVRYRGEARQALEQALAGRSQADGSGALVVRSLGVTRTAGRRGDQAGAAVGIAVGAVVIVTLVVLAIIADGKNGGTGPRLPGPRVAAPSTGFRPRAGAPPRFSPRPPGVLPGGGRPRVPRGAGPRPFPHGHAHGVDVGIGFQWWIPLGPGPGLDPVYPPPPDAAPPPPSADAESDEAPGGDAAPAPEGEAQADAAPAPKAIPLAAPEGPPIESRGFFDGDRLVLDAVVVDPETGEVLWTKRLERKVDPRDAKAVRAAVDALLGDGGWMPAEPAQPTAPSAS